MNQLWIPTGQHWGLTIDRQQRGDAGPFVAGAVPKIVWHTTEGTSFSGADATLKASGDEPHFLVSVDGKIVRQYIALNRSSKSLMHPAGTPETNRAGCIQIEVCGFAHDSQNWTEVKMQRLAALAVLIEHRVQVERRTHVAWAEPTVDRIPASHFLKWPGHIGHRHVPNNDHVDPGEFRITDLLHHMNTDHH